MVPGESPLPHPEGRHPEALRRGITGMGMSMTSSERMAYIVRTYIVRVNQAISLAGADHHHPLCQCQPGASPGKAIGPAPNKVTQAHAFHPLHRFPRMVAPHQNAADTSRQAVIIRSSPSSVPQARGRAGPSPRRGWGSCDSSPAMCLLQPLRHPRLTRRDAIVDQFPSQPPRPAVLPVVLWPRYGYPVTKEGLGITQTTVSPLLPRSQLVSEQRIPRLNPRPMEP